MRLTKNIFRSLTHGTEKCKQFYTEIVGNEKNNPKEEKGIRYFC